MSGRASVRATDRGTDGPSGRAVDSIATRLRSAVAAAPLLVRRRARRDLGALLIWSMIVASAALLAIIGPAHLTDTIDRGARDAVAAAGSATDLVIEAQVADPDSAFQLSTVRPSEISDVTAEVAGNLPSALRRTLETATLAVTGPRLTIGPADVQPALTDPNVTVRLTPAMLTPQNSRALEVVEGVLPADAADPVAPIEVLVSRAAASASTLAVGSLIALPSVEPSGGGSVPIPARVVGIVDEVPVDRPGIVDDEAWRDLPEVWTPTVLEDRGSTSIGITVLIPAVSVDRIVSARVTPFTGVLRYSFDAASFDRDLLIAGSRQSSRLVANSTGLADGQGYFDVSSGFADAVDDFPGRARATLAELSIVIAGVVGAAVLVLLLGSRVLVLRRMPDVLLERARGSSLAAIALRTLADSVLCLALAALIVAGVTRVTGISIDGDPVLLFVVSAVAFVAGVAQTLIAVRVRSTASTVGVNRRDGQRRRRQRAIGRLALEAAVLVLAALAVVSLLGRGLLQTASESVDPLLASTPLLIAAAIAILVARLVRWPTRVAAALSGRGRGIAGAVVASRLQRGIAVLPLTAVTVGVALVVGTGILGQTVRDGQEDASWQVVGADVRVEARFDEGTIARVADADGVEAASGFLQRAGVQLALGTSRSGVTLIAVDRRYGDLIAGLPELDGVTDPGDAPVFDELAVGVADAAPLPVIVDAAVADRLISDDVTIAIGNEDVPLLVAGTLRSGPDGYVDGPAVYVDLASLSSRLTAPLPANRLLALGRGSASAVERLDLTDADVLTRSGWLADRRGQALVAGVEQATLVGTGVLAFLALTAVVATALAGSAERARYLALLRTLGVRPRFGVLLAAIDQVPLLVASVVGGMLGGLGIAVLLSPALGLEFLTGGLASPEPVIRPLFLLLVVTGLVLVFALGTLIEVLVRRRDRVSDAIRVGETI